MPRTINATLPQTAWCPMRFALEVVGGKWKLAIICMLAEHSPARYSEVKRKVAGITNVMLAQSLKELESYGLVHREQYNEIPPRVEYTLTEKGRTLMPALNHLAEWGAANMPGAGRDARCRTCKQ
ncbi:Pyridoxal-dependent decarboxylase [uncultured delta proteobacterium]|uniref:Pyridoxal-dependent decarboxylase n=1 Tax=uncultured delta proteobacterium TaxID=34034 RepID=A0A212KDS3_9DELT|nr:Pyridoxal-dependent decarboxylase [uncultured delta proteobacterium]